MEMYRITSLSIPKYIVVVLGDGGVGKSELLRRLFKDNFCNEFDPTIEDYYQYWFFAYGQLREIEFIDTAGDLVPERLTEYQEVADGFILVYSITSPQSFARVRTLYSKVQERGKEVLVVGNKNDYEGLRGVSRTEGQGLVFKSQNMFQETSARTGTHVKETFLTFMAQLAQLDSEDEREPSSHLVCELRRGFLHTLRAKIVSFLWRNFRRNLKT